MELQFGSKQLDCLRLLVHEVQNSEQTQELKLSDGMPDVGRVISAWGQPIMRGKEWRSTEIVYTGGMLVWVLYAAEGDQQPQILNTWIPFQIRWNLPSESSDGQIRISCLPRFVDARSVSPRKIMVRCSMGVLAEAYTPDNISVFVPDSDGEALELLQNSYAMQMIKQAGEKDFLLDEELTVPGSVPIPKRIVYCTLEPELQEKRVLSDKLVFRGIGKLHLLYCAEGGQIHSWDFELPFSQLTELGNAYGADAKADIRLAVTGLEPELQEDGRLRIKCGMVGQYLISDEERLTVVEDAYSNDWDLDVSRTELRVPVILEMAKQSLSAEQSIQMDANLAADVRFLPDFPVERNLGDGMELAYPGTFQMLYYGEDSMLHGSSARWEGQEQAPTSREMEILTHLRTPEATANVGNGAIGMNAELPVERIVLGQQTIPMVTDVRGTQKKEKDPGRPTVILERMGERSLWDLAKQNGSTVPAIREANHLESEPAPGQMLLIPVQ